MPLPLKESELPQTLTQCSRTELDENVSTDDKNIVDNIVFKTVRTVMRNYIWNTDFEPPKREKCTICQTKSSYLPGSINWIEHVAGKTHFQNISFKVFNKAVLLKDLCETFHKCEKIVQDLDLKREPFQIKLLRKSIVNCLHKFKISYGSAKTKHLTPRNVRKFDTIGVDDFQTKYSFYPTTDVRILKRSARMEAFSVVKAGLVIDCNWAYENDGGLLKCLLCRSSVPLFASALINHVTNWTHIGKLYKVRENKGLDVTRDLYDKLKNCERSLKKLRYDCKFFKETSVFRDQALIYVKTGMKSVLDREKLRVYSKVRRSLYRREYVTCSGNTFLCIPCRKEQALSTKGIISHVVQKNHVNNICSSLGLSLEEVIQSLLDNLDKCKEMLKEINNQRCIISIRPLLLAVENAEVSLKVRMVKLQTTSDYL